MNGRSMFPFFIGTGLMFGLLAAACAFLIAYHEYSRHMLRPEQDPRRMALGTASVTFAFMVVATLVLYVALGSP